MAPDLAAQADRRRSPVGRLLGPSGALHPATAPLLADLSLVPRLGFKGRGTMAAMQRRGVVVEGTPNRVFRQPDGGLCLVLAPTEVLLLAGFERDGDHSGDRLADLERGWRIEDEERTYPLPRQDSHAWFALAGERAPDALATLCGVDLRLHKFVDNAVAQTSLARLNVILARADQGRESLGARPVFHLLVDSASAEYLWGCLATALAGVGGHIADLETLRVS